MRTLANLTATLPTPAEACSGLIWTIVALALMVLADGAALAVAGHEWGYCALFQTPRDAPGYVYDVALSAEEDTGVSLFSVSDGRMQGAFRRGVGFHRFGGNGATVRRPWPAESFPASVAAIPGGTKFAIACIDGAIHIADTESPTAPPIRFGRHHGSDLQSVQCSADGTRLLSLGCDSISCWDVKPQSLLWQRCEAALNAAVFDPDSRRIVAAASDGRVHEWDAGTGRTIRLVANVGDSPSNIALSHDGCRLAVATFKSLSVWDRRAGTRLWSCSHPQSQLSFSPDDKLLCSFSRVDKRWGLTLRESTSGRLAATLPGHSKRVFGTAYSAGGKLCSWSSDGTIRFWNAALGEETETESLVAPW